MPVGDKILVVDDEREIADLVGLYLENENYEVSKCYTAKDALECIDNTVFDLAVLDIMLPETNGLTVCQKIREKHSYPVIMLTAMDAEVDKITGLAMGADDYVTKPFRPLELVARVKAQLRRYKKYSGAAAQNEDVIVHSGLLINKNTHACFLDEKLLSLTPTEFSILCILCENKGNVIGPEKLFHAVWGDEYFNKNNNSISTHIRHLREKMDDADDNPKYIKTVWGVGYKIEQ